MKYAGKISDDDVRMMRNLLNNIVGETFDEYIYSTFQCFCRHKKQIILALDELNKWEDKRMIDLMMHSFDHRAAHKEKKRDIGDLSNMFRKEILSPFENIKKVTIMATGIGGISSYSLSLSVLLSFIDSITSLNQVIVKAV